MSADYPSYFQTQVQPKLEAAPKSSGAGRPISRRAAFGLVGLTLIGSLVGGGVAGTVAATRATGTVPAAVVSGTAPRTISTQAAPAANNVVGTVYRQASPSVVQIVVSGPSSAGPTRYGGGSGFVIDAGGQILTNNHVVEGARAITVRFTNGETREAQVLGTDRGNDLALIKVDLPAGVPVVPLGDSDQLGVGDQAIAIGSPFGLDQSVTEGIISAVQRTWAPGDGRVRRNLIQTDAPLNPGNSGGPLLNASGEVIGVNSMIESPIRGSVGVGFAVPINVAKRLLPQLQAGARLEPVWLGISGQALDAAIARDQGLSVQSGVLLATVVPNGPAARAGLRGGQGGAEQGGTERIPRGGDVIVAVDGTPIKDINELTDQLSGRQPGDVVKLTIVRDGREQQVEVTLRAWPAQMS